MHSEHKSSKRIFSCILVLSLMLNILLTSGIFPVTVWATDATSGETSNELVYYVDGVGSEGANGLSAATAFKTINEVTAAVEALGETAATKLLTIVICGEVDASTADGITLTGTTSAGKVFNSGASALSAHRGGVVFTSKIGNVDYRETNSATLKLPNDYMLLCNTTFENIKFGKNAQTVYANYYDLTIGENVEGTFSSYKLFLGTNNSIYCAAYYGKQVPAPATRDLTFTIKSSKIKDLDIFGYGYQGDAHSKENSYNVTLNIEGGSINSILKNTTEKPVVNDVTVCLGANSPVTVDFSNLATSTRIKGTKTVAYNNTTVSEIPATGGFTALKLTDAGATLSSLGTITDITMDDVSQLTLTAVPESPVNVTVTKAGETWNTTDALIAAPAGTAEEMVRIANGDAIFVYASSETGATWTLQEVAVEPEPIPEGHIFYVDGVGSGEKDGSSADNAFATLAELGEAIKNFSDEDAVKQLTVVVCGQLDATQDGEVLVASENTRYLLAYKGDVVFTSVLGATDYRKENEASIKLPDRMVYLSNTTFKDIKIAKGSKTVFANYNNLELGKGVEGTFASATLYLGRLKNVYDALQNSQLDTKTAIDDVTFTMKSGTVKKLDIFGYSYQGSGSGGKTYNVTVNIEGGTLTTLAANEASSLSASDKVYLDDLTVCVGVSATAFGMDGVASNTRIRGLKIIEYKNATVTEVSVEGFDVLKLTSSSVTLPAGMENLWSTIDKLQMTDDSVLTFTTIPTVPENAVEVTLIKTGEEWNISTPVITAPAGTVNMFEVVSPLDYGFVYADNGSGATWTAKYTGINIGTTGTAGEKLDISLGLPEDGSFTPVPENATPYETYLQKLEDLGKAKNEVNVVSPVAVKGAYELYVDSAKGDDSNSGSIDKPFKTIDKALSYVEALQKMEVKGVVVFLREGTYFAHEAITLNEKHSSKNGIPMIISAYNNEKVVITNSLSIPGSAFKPVTDVAIMDRLRDSAKSAVVQVDLKAMGVTQLGEILRGSLGGPNYQVFVNGNEYIPARYPNATKLWVGEVLDQGPISSTKTNMDSTGVEFKMQDFRPTTWQNDGNIWLKGSMYAEWDIKNIRVSEIRRDSIKLDGGSEYGARSLETNTYYYYNILEELDAPGEYYVDLNTGILYLYSIPNMDQATVTYSGNTDALITLNGTKNVVLNGLTIENSAGTGVQMTNCEQTIIQNTTITKVSTGVYMNDCKKSGIIYSEVSETANRPVDIRPEQVSFDYTPAHNFIQNCYIHNTGTKNPKYCGVYVQGTGNVISHNLFQGGFSVSIYLQYAKECIVEYNEIVGSPTGTNDGGAIYMPAETMGTGHHIRYNYIHDIGRFSEDIDPWGIYFDEGLSGCYAYGNVLVNVPGGFHNNGGSEHVIINNVVMNVEERAGSEYAFNGSNNQSKYTLDQKERGNTLKYYYAYMALSEEAKDLFKSRYPQTVALFVRMGEALATEAGEKAVGVYYSHDNYVANNIVYNHGTFKFEGINTTYKNNQKLFQDPFVDVANHNFNLKDPNSIAFDYVALDMDRVGIVTEDKQGIGNFEGIMPVQGEQKANSLELLLRWSIAAGADTYELKIATNPEMTENPRTIVLESTQIWFITDPYFNYDTTYYWTVTAYSTAESRDVTPVSTSVMSFKTMTKEEYLANNRADTAFLEETIKKAELLAEQIVAAGDLYDSATLAELRDAIEVAKAAKDNRDFTQVEVNVAKLNLEDVMQFAKSNRKIRKVTFDSLNVEDWSDSLADFVQIEMENGALRLDVEAADRSEAIYAHELHVRDILCFKFKLDAKQQWNGFALAQTNRGTFITAGTDGYFICIKPDVVELQKYYGGQKVVQIDVKIPMDLYKSGEYADVEVGAINYPDGSVGIHFRLNGELIFDPAVFVDTVEDNVIPGTNGQKLPYSPVTGCGNFGIVVHRDNQATYIMQADEEDLGIVEDAPTPGPSDPVEPSDPTVPSEPSEPEPSDPAGPSEPVEPDAPSDTTENNGFFASIMAFFASIIAFIKRLLGL